MRKYKIVIDTNVIIAGLRSKRGASYKLISSLASKQFDLNISVPLILEYESIAIRHLDNLLIDKNDLENFLNYICTIGNKCKIFFLWRPFLKDPKDDFVLELAANSGSDFIITYNQKDFKGSNKLGIAVLTPKELLNILEEEK